MTYQIRFRRAARIEYDSAAAWYESKRRGLGREFIDAIDSSMAAVGEAPHRYRVAQGDVRCAHVRHFPYMVYFRIRANQVIVLAVFHVRRDPLVWRERV